MGTSSPAVPTSVTDAPSSDGAVRVTQPGPLFPSWLGQDRINLCDEAGSYGREAVCGSVTELQCKSIICVLWHLVHFITETLGQACSLSL